MSITDKQRRHLRGLAHHLKPVVMVGQKGLTEGVFNELDIALESHELVKLRISSADREQRQEMIAALNRQSGSELIQTIGQIAVLYRRHPKEPKIKLPA